MGGMPDRTNDDGRHGGSERRRRAVSVRGQQQGRAGRGRMSQSRCGGTRADWLRARQGSVDRLLGWVGPLGRDDEILVYHPR
jgi:hypothetical protein